MIMILGTIFCVYLLIATLTCGLVMAVRGTKEERAQRLLVRTRALLEVELRDKPCVSGRNRSNNIHITQEV